LKAVYFLGKKVLHLVTLGLDATTGAILNVIFTLLSPESSYYTLFLIKVIINLRHLRVVLYMS
jgi:hypothetical protein